ncbi:MAG TPA: hypothetical protein VFB58_13305 [Chloroflexota bacterium]|nr:hypothetical protein [Chloroflexota bacterium]
MNDDERRRILRLVAEGKVSAEEGAELLDALQSERRGAENAPSPTLPIPPVPPVPPAPGTAGRSLIIRVTEGDESRVNLRIPLGLARAAGKFIPRRAQHDLGEHGIDLNSLIEGVAGGVDKGPILQIEDGEDTVYIGVE